MKPARGTIVLSAALVFMGLTTGNAQATFIATVGGEAVHDSFLGDVAPPAIGFFQISSTTNMNITTPYGSAPAQNLVGGIAINGYAFNGTVSGDHGGTVIAFAAGAGPYAKGPGSGNSGGIVDGRATLTYNFQLVGPASSSPIPVEVIANGYAGSSGAGTAAASIFLNSQLIGAARTHFDDTQSFHFDGFVQLLPNQFNTVQMTAIADSVDFPLTDPRTHLPAGVGYATADPQFILSPEFAGLYHFVGLPSPVPLPASFWLLGSVFGPLSLLRRRARHPANHCS